MEAIKQIIKELENLIQKENQKMEAMRGNRSGEGPGKILLYHGIK